MKKLLFLVCSSLIFSSSYAAIIDINHNGTAKIKVPSPQLGGGYSNDMGQAVPIKCINAGPVTTSGMNQGVVNTAKLYDYNTVQNQLNFSANGHVGIGLFSASASYDFMQYLENDNLSESLIYRTNLQFMDTNYNTPASGSVLNEVGAMHWKNGPDDFRYYCGDSYIAQMHNIGYLYIALQLHFKTAIDKQKFDANFSASYGDFASFNANFQHQIDKMNIQGEIHLVGLQIGGMPQYIGAIFQNPDPTQPTPMSQCSLNNSRACQLLMTSVLGYLTPGDGRSPQSHYPDQFGNDPRQAPVNTAEMGFETSDYYAIVPEIHTDSKLTPAMIDMRDHLGNIFQTQNNYFQRASYLARMTNIPYAYDDYRTKLQAFMRNLTTNISNLQTAGVTCFTNLPNCVNNGNAVLNTLLPVDPSVMKLPDTFTVNIVDSTGLKHQQTFVAVDQSQPYAEIFHGAETSPSSQTFDLTIAFDSDTGGVSIQQIDHDSGQLVANFDGALQTTNNYAGTVQYATGSTGTWTGVLQPSQGSQLKLSLKTFGKKHQ